MTIQDVFQCLSANGKHEPAQSFILTRPNIQIALNGKSSEADEGPMPRDRLYGFTKASSTRRDPDHRRRKDNSVSAFWTDSWHSKYVLMECKGTISGEG